MEPDTENRGRTASPPKEEEEGTSSSFDAETGERVEEQFLLPSAI